MESKVIKQQMEINKIRNEIEAKKGAIKAYRMHIKDKAIRRQNRIALLKRQQKRCPDCDIGFNSEEQLQNHINTIHTEDKEYMIKIAKDYNEKMQEDDEEEQEVIKDLIQETQANMLSTIRNETGALRDNLIESKRFREDEFNKLETKHDEYRRELEEEKHVEKQIMNQNDIAPLMQNFEKEIKNMFKEVHIKLEKDEEMEREKDENFRKIENDYLHRIDKQNKKINELKSSQNDLKETIECQSIQDMSNTFNRLDMIQPVGAAANVDSQRQHQKQIEKEKQEREINQMETEDLRMKQIILNEKSEKEKQDLENKLKEESEIRLKLEIQKQERLAQRQIEELEEKRELEMKELEQRRIRDEEFQKELEEENKRIAEAKHQEKIQNIENERQRIEQEQAEKIRILEEEQVKLNDTSQIDSVHEKAKKELEEELQNLK